MKKLAITVLILIFVLFCLALDIHNQFNIFRNTIAANNHYTNKKQIYQVFSQNTESFDRFRERVYQAEISPFDVLLNDADTYNILMLPYTEAQRVNKSNLQDFGFQLLSQTGILEQMEQICREYGFNRFILTENKDLLVLQCDLDWELTLGACTSPAGFQDNQKRKITPNWYYTIYSSVSSGVSAERNRWFWLYEQLYVK